MIIFDCKIDYVRCWDSASAVSFLCWVFWFCACAYILEIHMNLGAHKRMIDVLIFQCGSYLVVEKALQPTLVTVLCHNVSIIEPPQDICLVTVLLGHLRACLRACNYSM